MSATARKQGPISRSQSQALTREALLDAAEILILEQSIPGMSLRAVCTQAGFSQGASYSNFANREELLLAVMERNLEQKAAVWKRCYPTAATATSMKRWKPWWGGSIPSAIAVPGPAWPSSCGCTPPARV